MGNCTNPDRREENYLNLKKLRDEISSELFLSFLEVWAKLTETAVEADDSTTRLFTIHCQISSFP